MAAAYSQPLPVSYCRFSDWSTNILDYFLLHNLETVCMSTAAAAAAETAPVVAVSVGRDDSADGLTEITAAGGSVRAAIHTGGVHSTQQQDAVDQDGRRRVCLNDS